MVSPYKPRGYRCRLRRTHESRGSAGISRAIEAREGGVEYLEAHYARFVLRCSYGMIVLHDVVEGGIRRYEGRDCESVAVQNGTHIYHCCSFSEYLIVEQCTFARLRRHEECSRNMLSILSFQGLDLYQDSQRTAGRLANHIWMFSRIT